MEAEREGAGPFRPTALARRRATEATRPLGRASLAVWSTALTLFTAAALSLLIGWGEIRRRETAVGELTPDLGLVPVHAPIAGRVRELRVIRGQRVRPGQVLIVLDGDLGSHDGGMRRLSMTARAERIAELERAIAAERTAAEGLAALHLATREQLSAERSSLQEEAALLIEQVELRERELARVEALSTVGHVPPALRDRHEASLIDSRAALLSATRAAHATEARILETERAQIAVQAAAERQIAGYRSQIDLLSLASVEDSARAATVLRAPIAGTITDLLATRGADVAAGTLLLSMSPDGAELIAVVSASGRAAGRLGPGDEVQLSLPSLPPRRRETSRAKVLGVAPATDRPGSFRIRIGLGPLARSAAEGGVTLHPGMRVEARMLLGSEPVLDWILATGREHGG